MSHTISVDLKKFPTLFKAWELMLVDNTGTASIIKTMRAQMRETVLKFPHPPQPAEEELAKLSKEQLDTLCTGDEDERPPVSSKTEAILTYLFECL